jgi:hypothetical protein
MSRGKSPVVRALADKRLDDVDRLKGRRSRRFLGDEGVRLTFKFA